MQTTLEKSVGMMYNRSSLVERVYDMRLDMFDQTQRPYEAIPSTLEALKQHVKHTTSLVCI